MNIMNMVCRYGMPLKRNDSFELDRLKEKLASMKVAVPTTEQIHPGISPAAEDSSWTSNEVEY